MTNALKTIENIKGKINPRYDMTIHHIQVLLSESSTAYELAYNSFTFGYAQGIQAYQSRNIPPKKQIISRPNRQLYF